MSITTWQNEDAARLHQSGLSIGLAGEFAMADECFRQSYEKLDREELLERGHVLRDWARVHAGLGSIASRNDSINEALRVHNLVFHRDVKHAEAYPDTTATELAASLHVSARIFAAKSLETRTSSIREDARYKMANAWKKSLDLFERYGNNPDYFHQMLSHGSLGMTALGNEQDSSLAKRIVDAAWVELPIMSLERKVIVGLGHAGLVKVMRPLLKPIAVKTVAGPYLVRPATR